VPPTDEIGALEAALLEQVERCRHPVGEVVQTIVSRGAGKSRQRRRDHATALGQAVEELGPAR